MKLWHRIKLPDGTYSNGEVMHGPDGGNWPTDRFGLPKDLTGKSVLDVGCWDGFFSFEAEKRGALSVGAVDIVERENFLHYKKILNSKAEFDTMDIQNLPTMHRTYDVVFCFGVLYHIKNPLVAIENLAKLTREICLIETAISEIKWPALMEYRPGFDNDPTNYYYPNSEYMRLAAKQSGFTSCEEIYNMGSRATYRLTKGN